MSDDKTLAWQEYEKGIDYKTQINLYTDVRKNEAFYAGDQWKDIPHENMPTCVINIVKTIVAWKISAIKDRRIKMKYSVIGQTENDDIKAYIKQINGYSEVLWERLRTDYVISEVLKDAAISGDGILYYYWEPTIRTGQKLTGDIARQLVDNVNYFPGDPNDPDVQSQPYIILAFRTHIKHVKAEATRNKKNGGKEIELDLIVGDSDTEYTSGDRGRTELDDNTKCTVLLKLWKEDVEEDTIDENGNPTKEIFTRVFSEKSVRGTVIQPKKNTKLSRYPVALINWDTRKNCCHGVPEVTELRTNQVFISKTMALAQIAIMHMAFPVIAFDQTQVTPDEMANRKIGEPIPVNGDPTRVVHVISPATMSVDLWRGIDTMKELMFEMTGALNAARGNINDPDNTSALIAVRDAAMQQLQICQDRLYAFAEDLGLIELDFEKAYYAGRLVPIKAKVEATDVDGNVIIGPDGNPVIQETVTYVPMPDLSKYELTAKIDVGPSTLWSEIQTIQTMDNLLSGGYMTPAQYYKRMEPFGYIPDVQELIEYWTQKEAEQAQQAAQLAAMQPNA